MLQGALCVVESSGARIFARGTKRFIRLGDYQALKDTVSQIVQFGGNCNNLASMCVNCIHKYTQVGKAHERRNRQNKEVRDHLKSRNHNKEARMDSVSEMTRAMKDYVLACDIVGGTDREERMRWSDQNLFNLEADEYRSPDILTHTKASRENALSFLYPSTSVHSSVRSHQFLRLLKVHNVIIMLMSTQMKDELLFKLYISLTHGRASPEEMLAPLMRVSYFELFKHFGRCCQKYSGLHNIRAEGLLKFILVLQGTYAGEVPDNVNKMHAMRYISDKIAAVSLNQNGIYLKGGRPRMGADSHCRGFNNPIIYKTFYKWNMTLKNPESEVDRLSSLIPPHPGRQGK